MMQAASLLSDAASVAKDIGTVTAIVTPAVYAAWRYVLRPRVYEPIHALHLRIETALDSIAHVEPIVKEMSRNIGPNGGKSLIDNVRQLSARMNLLVDDLPWPTFEASGTGHNTRVNHMFERTFGYSASDLAGNGWKVLLHPDDAHEYFEAWAMSVADIRSFTYPFPNSGGELRFVTKDNHVMQVIVNAAPYTTNDLTVWMGTVRVRGISIGERPPR